MKEKIVIIVGPTAVGKTELGMEVAKTFNGEIISGDSMQVYKQLDIGTAKATKKENPTEAQGLLSQKLDSMLKEAKIDGELMASLGNSIKNFEGAAKSISPTVDAMVGQKKYAEEMSNAASQMEALNGLYKVQLESADRNAQANKDIADNAAKLKEQMQSMTSNIASLNAVYGGMLTAMSNRG